MFLMPALKRRLTQHLKSWPREELTPWSSRPIHSCWPSATNLFGSLRSTRFLQSTFYASSLMLADCRRLMTTPGVGPVVSLTYRATVDVPARFRKSKSVGAVFGLTCAKYQSGEVDWDGRISRCGDEMTRVMLYEAAQSMMRSKKWSWLKAWAMQIARRRGMKKAIVALARRLAVIMHRIWVDGTEFRWTREQAAATA